MLGVKGGRAAGVQAGGFFHGDIATHSPVIFSPTWFSTCLSLILMLALPLLSQSSSFLPVPCTLRRRGELEWHLIGQAFGESESRSTKPVGQAPPAPSPMASGTSHSLLHALFEEVWVGGSWQLGAHEQVGSVRMRNFVPPLFVCPGHIPHSHHPSYGTAPV